MKLDPEKPGKFSENAWQTLCGGWTEKLLTHYEMNTFRQLWEGDLATYSFDSWKNENPSTFKTHSHPQVHLIYKINEGLSVKNAEID